MYNAPDLAIFSITWYFFTITTYGVWIPAGLFLPGIIMGGTLGRLYTNLIQMYLPMEKTHFELAAQ